MSWNGWIRRIHVYLAVFLLPWFFMYAIAALVFNHPSLLSRWYDDGVPDWSVRFEREYHLPVPKDADLREVASKILEDIGLQGSFGVRRPNESRLNIYVFTFFSAARVTYFVKQGRLIVEEKRFRWDHFLTGLHARAGFRQEAFLADAWAVLVDLTGLGTLIWAGSGVYIWWRSRRARLWGIVALAGGIITFAIFLVAL